MKTHKAMAHLYFNLGQGSHSVFDSGSMHETLPGQYVLLASQEVEFQISKTDDELTQAQIDGLEKTKLRILGEAEAQATKIDAQIQSLRAIAHDPA